jgi:FkbM family methyltransferase
VWKAAWEGMDLSYPKRPIAFVLASTDHGTMILNRNDQHGDANNRYGVGIEILMTSAFCADEVALAIQLLQLRRGLYGDGVVAIDCGANIGVHSLDWGRQMTGWGSVIAIEAQERIYYALAGNIAINNSFNVQAIHAAVADQDGIMRIPEPNYHLQASFGSLELKPLAHPENIGQVIDYSEAGTKPVRAIKLDSLGLQRLDFLKIDVEGMEIDVLNGAVQLLRACRPVLMIEHHKTDAVRMTALLRELGYEIFNPGGMNLLAVHGEDPVRQQIVGGAT